MTAGPYTDHHVHLLAAAAALLSVDVSRVHSLRDMEQAVRSAAVPAGGWLRAWGYEEWQLEEGRHPRREDLDRMAPDRPLVVHHRSGHAAVLNSAALAEVGAADHADGVLFDRHDLLSRAPRLPSEDLAGAAAALSREWAAAGVAALVDATHTNGPAELEIMSAWRSAGVLLQGVTAMVGPDHTAAVPPFGARVGEVAVGPVKIMPPAAAQGPWAHELAELVAASHRDGRPVAVHVVDFDVLEATLDAFERSPAPSGTADRIEHNALSLPEQVSRIARTGATVVVNPGFLIHRQEKYRLQVSEVERRWLIRIGSLLRAGIRVRAGSDCPVTPVRPSEVVAAAMSHPFAPEESVSRAEARQLLDP